MKKRIFYVINLDRGRIMTILILFGAFISVSFLSGFHMGKQKSGMPLYNPDGEVSYLNEKNYGLPVLDHSSETADQAPSDERLTKLSAKDASEQEISGEVSSIEEEEEASAIKPEKKSEKRSAKRKNISDKKNETKKEDRKINTTAQKDKSSSKKNRSAKESDSKTASGKSSADRKSAASRKEEAKNTAKSEKTNPKSPLLSSSSPRLSSVENSAESVGKNSAYTLQIGAFNNDETANRMKNQLAADGFKAYVISDGSQYKVRVGKSLTGTKIDSMQQQLKDKQYASYRIKE